MCVCVPQVDVFDGEQAESLQRELLHSVPGHAEALDGAQSLQYGRNAAELVEREAEVAEALQGAQLHRQRRQHVPVQQQRLQAETVRTHTHTLTS